MIRGSCLCGTVRFEVDGEFDRMTHCHCSMCRKAHGSAYSTILPVAREGFAWLAGEDALSSYESSPGKRRWFCATCGSQLISTRDADADALLLRAGCIDALGDGRPVAHGWVGSMAQWHSIDDELPRFERGFPGAPPGVDDA